MTFLLSNWRIIGAFMLVVALSLGAYKHGVDTTSTKYELQITADKLGEAQARELSRAENDKSIAKLQGEKYAAQKRINDLADELRRARVLLPGCGDIMPSDPATAADNQATAGRELLPDTSESPQRALDRFMEGADNAAHDADTVVSECRVVYEWAKSIGTKSGVSNE